MRGILPFLRRARAWLRRGRHDDELREEIAQHIELRRRQLIEAGMDPRDAAYEARRLFGNVTAIREETREMWSFESLETLVQDTRFGTRLLRRSPAFTCAAVASLAIGIGSAAAVFSLADGLLFRHLPVNDPKALVLFRWMSGPELPFESLNGYGQQNAEGTSSTSFALAAFERVRRTLADRADVFAFADLYTVNVSVNGRPETASAHVVSGNYFTVLGLRPSAGRLLVPDDDRPGAPPAAVIGYDLWQRQFGADPGVVGRTIVINGISHEIAGVLPGGFHGTLQVGQPCDVMVPLTSYGTVTHRTDEDPADAKFWWVLMMARLKPGVTSEQVRQPADTALKQSVLAATPDYPADKLPRMNVEPGGRGQAEDRAAMRQPIQIMAGVVAIVLLVACANVANLLLARGRARAREVAVRTAIGAPRSRIVRQLLTEGLLLGLVASGAGLFLAQWISAAILPALTQSNANFTIRYALDLRIVAFTCALGIGCSLLFALAPALRATQANLPAVLQESARGTIGTRSRFATGGALVVTQVALSLLLLSAATLLAWSAWRLQAIDPGFDPENLLTFSVDTSLNGYDAAQSRAFVGRALEALRALPGVVGASATSHRLIANSSSIGVARPEGAPAVDPNAPEAREIGQKNRVWRLNVDERFFETFRIPVLRGATFPPAVPPDGAPMAVINEALARQLFGTVDAVGRRFVTGLRGGGKPIQVMGVVADARYTAVRSDPPPTAYFPYQQAGAARMTFAVRTAGEPLTVAGTVRETLRNIDDTVPLFALRTQEEQIQRSLVQERLFANLALLLGAVTLALSAVGLYGLLAYTVTRRTPEIGVRIALGAERRQVRWMVLRQSLVLVACGVALGVPAAAASARFLESLLFGLSPYDPRALGAAVTVMVAAALGAAYLPARRASRIDPIAALRAE